MAIQPWVRVDRRRSGFCKAHIDLARAWSRLASAQVIRQDYIRRAIEQLGAAVAAAAGLRREDPEQALQLLQAAKSRLPIVPGMLERTPAPMLPGLLPSRELQEQLAELFELEAQLHKQRGDTQQALAALRRCAALRGIQESKLT